MSEVGRVEAVAERVAAMGAGSFVVLRDGVCPICGAGTVRVRLTVDLDGGRLGLAECLACRSDGLHRWSKGEEWVLALFRRSAWRSSPRALRQAARAAAVGGGS
jgi:hypothetical protein